MRQAYAPRARQPDEMRNTLGRPSSPADSSAVGRPAVSACRQKHGETPTGHPLPGFADSRGLFGSNDLLKDSPAVLSRGGRCHSARTQLTD